MNASASIESAEQFRKVMRASPAADARALKAASERNDVLTKPPGSLGRLEELALWYASWKGDPRPALEKIQIAVFAGNHGAAGRGVSAYPAEVTAQMVANFRSGGAAINQLAELAGARLDVVALDLDRPTADFVLGPAMPEGELLAGLRAGWDAVRPGIDLLVLGEMGIGNTAAAAAVSLALHGGEAGDWVGAGTGVAGEALRSKIETVRIAVARGGKSAPRRGLDILADVGGRELAAMAGAIVRARQMSIPVMLDGFVCCAAAAALQAESPTILDHCAAGHRSAEAAHGRLLDAMGKKPLLDLGMRLGEASGAAVAVHVLRCAVACLSGMASFAEADISPG